MILTITVVGCFLITVTNGKCWIHNAVVLCEDSMPNEVQDGVTTVKIFNLDLSVYLQKDIFQHRSWRNVEHLLLQPDVDSSGGKSLNIETRPSFVLPSTFSDHLNSLVELSVTSKRLIGIHKGAFHNLTKLESLDFAGNGQVKLTNFTAALRGNNMRNLKRLNISEISVWSKSIRTFGSEFFDCFRHLEELDLSQSDSVLIPYDFADALPFLQSLNLENSGYLAVNFMAALFFKPNGSSFKFLRKLNINNALFPDSLLETAFKLPGEFDLSATPQLNLTHFRARKIVLDDFECVPSVVLLENRAVLYIEFPSTNIRRPLIALPVDNFGAIPLQVLDISHNSIISIDLALIGMAKYMVDIDLSNNKLYLMEGRKLKYCFKGTPKIYRINLSNNRLAKLPVELFSTNHILEYIDLSYNKLSTLSFKISHLLKLKVLDVSFNEIHFFEDSALTRLYDFRQSVLVYSEKFTMKLGGNPYVCSCESKEFLRWMIDPGFSNYIHPKVVECLKSKSQTSVIIDKSALADAEFECKLTMIIGVSSALSAIVVIMLGILVFIMCRRYRARKREKQLALFIMKRRDTKQAEQTPIFLSYCSENYDFVVNVIYPKLNSTLQKILKSDKRCIATGDLDFRPGIHVNEEIVSCIETCSVFVACVSNAFCRKAWCKSEVLTAIHENRPVILIFLEEVEPSLMPKVMRKHFLATTRVTWCNQDEMPKPDVETICRGIVQLMAKEQGERVVETPNNGGAASEDLSAGIAMDYIQTIL
ncbi:toll-like receptor 13 [Mya arenaria]|uniref:toll-like receptor 13 n=1 Tax=Mya arenaria TaxID=6604 RepID=UPI0022DF0A02|nr:toll-like receptor 13 [Mya arenaria]